MSGEDEHNARVAAAFRYFKQNPGTGALIGNVGDDGVTRWRSNGVEVEVPGTPVRRGRRRDGAPIHAWALVVAVLIASAAGAWTAWSRARRHDAMALAAKASP